MFTWRKQSIYMKDSTQAFIQHVVTTLEQALAPFPLPLVDCMIDEFGHDPFLILISCLLSLRARDVVTIHVCRELFSHVRTPQEILD